MPVTTRNLIQQPASEATVWCRDWRIPYSKYFGCTKPIPLAGEHPSLPGGDSISPPQALVTCSCTITKHLSPRVLQHCCYRLAIQINIQSKRGPAEIYFLAILMHVQFKLQLSQIHEGKSLVLRNLLKLFSFQVCVFVTLFLASSYPQASA